MRLDSELRLLSDTSVLKSVSVFDLVGCRKKRNLVGKGVTTVVIIQGAI